MTEIDHAGRTEIPAWLDAATESWGGSMKRAFLTMLRGICAGLAILAVTSSAMLLVSGTAMAQSAGQCTTQCVQHCIGAQNPTVCEAICRRNCSPSARRCIAQCAQECIGAQIPDVCEARCKRDCR
jgi:hypothetical protein